MRRIVSRFDRRFLGLWVYGPWASCRWMSPPLWRFFWRHLLQGLLQRPLPLYLPLHLPLLLLLCTVSVKAAPVEVLNLAVGQAHLLNETSVKRIVVGNGRIIQATALESKQILIIPEAVGQSSLHLWNKIGQEKQWLINVHNGDGQRALSEIQGLFAGSNGLNARVVADKVIVEGSGLSEEQSRRVSELAKRYPQLVDLSSKVAIERMIAMDVRMVEVKREALRNIGVKWSGSGQGPSFGVVGDLHRSDRLTPGGIAQNVVGLDIRPRIAPFASNFSLLSSFTSMLNLLVQNGDAFVLAEPQLSCRSGGAARLVAGGELPIPVTSSLGSTSVQFKEYGVKFDVQPVATDDGMISAKIATEISAINFDVTVREIPGLTKRRAETEVNLRENDTLVIAGLISEESSGHTDKLAGFGDLPILGRLFKSRLFRENKTELVVFITPRLIQADQSQNRQRIEDGNRLIEGARERKRVID
jgi:pilus assembly protein CpaC